MNIKKITTIRSVSRCTNQKRSMTASVRRQMVKGSCLHSFCVIRFHLRTRRSLQCSTGFFRKSLYLRLQIRAGVLSTPYALSGHALRTAAPSPVSGNFFPAYHLPGNATLPLIRLKAGKTADQPSKDCMGNRKPGHLPGLFSASVIEPRLGSKNDRPSDCSSGGFPCSHSEIRQ